MALRTLSKANTWPSFFGDIFEPWDDWFKPAHTAKALTTPRVNITEDAKGYQMSVAAPGLHKSDFDISINGNILTVTAQKEENKEQNDEQYTRQEYNYSSFSRSFTLPEEVEQGKIEATYDGGVLKLSLPKTEKALGNSNTAIPVK